MMVTWPFFNSQGVKTCHNWLYINVWNIHIKHVVSSAWCQVRRARASKYKTVFFCTTNAIYQCQKQTIVWFQECFPLLYMQPEETTTVVLMEICRLDGFIGIIWLTVDNVWRSPLITSHHLYCRKKRQQHADEHNTTISEQSSYR